MANQKTLTVNAVDEIGVVLDRKLIDKDTFKNLIRSRIPAYFEKIAIPSEKLDQLVDKAITCGFPDVFGDVDKALERHTDLYNNKFGHLSLEEYVNIIVEDAYDNGCIEVGES